MSGLDTGKATEGPKSDGLGVATHDSARSGAEATPAAREIDGEPSATAEIIVPVTPDTVQPVKAVPRTASPWRHSRKLRGARRTMRKPGARAQPAWIERLGAIPMPAIPGSVWLPWLGGALALVWVGATSLHPVGAHEQAIVTSPGAASPALGPGLAVSWPWPIGSAHVEDVTSVRHLALPDGDGEHLLLTRDGALVDLAYDVRWRIRDLRRFEQNLADPARTLPLAAQTAMRASVAETDFATALGTGRDTLAQGAARRLQAMLDAWQAGIVIDAVDIRRVDPPARLADALRTVAAARNDAATEATEARSWSHQLIVHAQAEASAFDRIEAQYRLAPAVIRRQMYYATMERVLSQSDKVIVDAPGVSTTLPPLAAPAADATGHGAKAGDGR